MRVRHEDDVVVAHLQPCGQEIAAGIAEADGENDRNERPVEPRHVGAEKLGHFARLLTEKEHRARISLDVAQSPGLRHGLGEVDPPSAEGELALRPGHGAAAAAAHRPKGNEFLRTLGTHRYGRRA